MLFGSLKTMLLEHLLGFTGTDVVAQGEDPEADAVLTIGHMKHVIATRIVKNWRKHPAERVRAKLWCPGAPQLDGLPVRRGVAPKAVSGLVSCAGHFCRSLSSSRMRGCRASIRQKHMTRSWSSSRAIGAP